MPLTQAPATGAQLGRVEPVVCPSFMASGGQSLTAQSAYLMLVRVSKPVTVTKISVYTAAATANCDLAILDASFAKQAGITAPIAATAGGLTTGTLTASFTYQPGVDYYNTVLLDATVAIVRGFGGVAVIFDAGSGTGTQCALSKAVAQNTIPNPVTSPVTMALGLWIVGHN